MSEVRNYPNALPGDGDRDWDALLERYLDGGLSAAEMTTFEARIAESAALRAEVDAQRAIDVSVRRRFAVPDKLETPFGADGARQVAAVQRGVLARIGWARIAAALLVGTLGVFLVVLRRQSAPTLESPGAAYLEITNAGFQPYIVCTDQEEFAHYTLQHLGQAMTVATSADVTLIGWNLNGEVLSEATDSLLATVGNAKVIVFMDQKGNRRSLPATSEGLHVFRQTVGTLECVEVSPLAEPRLLPGLKALKQEP